MASANGKDAEELVRDAVDRVLSDHARFMEGVDRGIAQADRREFVDHKEVRKRIERILRR